jgi:cell division protease FtsH
MGGYTRFLPPEDRSLMSQSQFEDQIATMMGGRSAELMVFDEVTTGASSDLERSTDTARQMVTRYGMSRKLGPRTFGKTEQLVFLGRDIAENRNYSEAIAEQIDDEVTEIIMRAHERATEVLRGHRDDLDRVSEYLIEHETMDVPALEALLRGEEPPEPLSDPPEPEPEPEDQPPEPEGHDRPPAGRRIAEEPGGAA